MTTSLAKILRKKKTAILAVLAVFLLSSASTIAAAPSLEALPTIKLQSEDRIALGKMLFFDRKLSGDGTMSCAVCHIPAEAFTDGLELSGAYPTNKHWRNTPTLLNAVYLDTFFWDGMSDSLKVQAAGPIESPFEMNADLHYLSAKLTEIPEYQEAFKKAFARPISRETILAALEAFEETLTVTDSPFDRYLAGEKTALDSLAKEGMDIFFDPRGGCSTCHSGPFLTDQKFHNLGVADNPLIQSDPQRRATMRAILASQGLPMLSRDPGRYLVSKNNADMGAFRTPPLRQVGQTGPYMHNGTLKTLPEVVDFFSQGGGDDPNKTPLLTVPNFNDQEKAALVAFLESLSGTVPEIHRPRIPGE